MNFEKLTTKFQQAFSDAQSLALGNENHVMLPYKLGNYLIVLLTCFPIAYYFYLINLFAVNIPLQDDYGTMIRFMNNYFAPTADKLSLLFSQTGNEHRLAFNRFVVLGLYSIFNEVNFKLLIFIGNIGLLFLFILLFKISQLRSKLPVFIGCAFLLFQIEHWESMTWAMAALSNYYVLLFALLSIYCLQQKSVSGFYLSILLGIIATYTNGNGLFVLYINFMSLIIDYFSDRKATNLLDMSRYYFVIYGITTAIVTLLYFLNYSKTGHHDAMSAIVIMPLFFIKHFLLMLGSGFALENPMIGIIVGITIVLLTSWLGYTQYFQRNPSLFYFLLFMLVSVLVASLTRAGFGVLEQALSSRYRLYSVLIVILLAVSILEHLEIYRLINRYILIIFIGLSISFSLYSFNKNTELLANRQHFLVTAIRHIVLREYTEFAKLTHAKDPKRVIDNLQQAIDHGYYQIPAQYSPPKLP